MQKWSNRIRGPLWQSPSPRELSDGTYGTEEKKTGQTYIMMHRLALGTPGSEERKRSQVALWAIYLPHAALNRISSLIVSTAQPDSRPYRSGHPTLFFFIQHQCPSLAGSPKAPREKIPVPLNRVPTPLTPLDIHRISFPWIVFPDDRCTGTCILG